MICTMSLTNYLCCHFCSHSAYRRSWSYVFLVFHKRVFCFIALLTFGVLGVICCWVAHLQPEGALLTIVGDSVFGATLVRSGCISCSRPDSGNSNRMSAQSFGSFGSKVMTPNKSFPVISWQEHKSKHPF